MKKRRDRWSAVDPIGWQCGQRWLANRCCALFSILFGHVVGDDHLVAQFVDQQVVDVKTDCHRHQFATFGFSDGRPPFFAAAKRPSIKVSSPSINVRYTYNHILSSSQQRNRGQHVDGLGYVVGKSGQPAPERQGQRMPSNS